MSNTKSCNKKERMTIRLTNYQMQCLNELKEGLGSSYSLLIRTIIGDFLARNEDYLEKIISQKKLDYAKDKFAFEEGEEEY